MGFLLWVQGLHSCCIMWKILLQSVYQNSKENKLKFASGLNCKGTIISKSVTGTRAIATIAASRQSCVDSLSWPYFYRHFLSNCFFFSWFILCQGKDLDFIIELVTVFGHMITQVSIVYFAYLTTPKKLFVSAFPSDPNFFSTDAEKNRWKHILMPTDLIFVSIKQDTEWFLHKWLFLIKKWRRKCHIPTLSISNGVTSFFH